MASAISGQKAVATAGTELALGDLAINGPLLVKAHFANTGFIYIGLAADGTVSSSSGFILDGGEYVRFDFIENLSQVKIDSSVNGEGVSWIRLDIP